MLGYVQETIIEWVKHAPDTGAGSKLGSIEPPDGRPTVPGTLSAIGASNCPLVKMFGLTLNSIRGPFRPESKLAYTQHWYLADVTLKTLRILRSRLSE